MGRSARSPSRSRAGSSRSQPGPSRSRSRSRSSSPSHGDRRVVVKYALVKWLTGQHEGQYSHNVNISWVRDFDLHGPFDANGYAIEWQVGSKPRNGWHIYDGLVLEVSDDLQFLKRKEEERLAADQAADQVAHQAPPQPPQPAPQPAPPQPANQAAAPHAAPQANQPADHNNALVQALIGALQPLQAQAAAVAAGNGAVAAAADGPSTQPDQVKIGKVLCVPKSCYLQAKHARSPTSMTMYLTRAAFSKRRLLRSSYAGQQRKLHDGTVVKKPSLKRYQIMRDIQDFVLNRFLITQSAFGAAVNSCTGEKARARPETEYEAEISSDEDV